MPLCLTINATTNKPSLNGPQTPPHAAAKTGPNTKKAALNPSDPHWVLSGSLLTDLLIADLSVIAEGPLLNKVFPSKKDYHATLKFGLNQWTKRNGLTSLPSNEISDLNQSLWQQHLEAVTCHITKPSITAFHCLFDGAAFHCEDKQASSLRLFCPCLYYQAIGATFMDTSIFEPVHQEPQDIVNSLVSTLQRPYGRSYPWAIGKGRQLPAGYILAKKKKAFEWTTHHFLCGLAFSADAQHPGQTNIPTHSRGMS